MSRARDQRGVAMVEVAVLLPVLAVMAFGVIEVGLAWRDRLAVQSAVRAGVRTGSAEGRLATADEAVLLAVGAALHDAGLANVEWVVVYESATGDGRVPQVCTDPAPRGVADACNAYTGAQLTQVVDGTAPATWFGCGAGSLDHHWCPADRQNVQALGADYLGVWVRVRHPMLTGFFGRDLTLVDMAVMRLEPQEA